MWVSRLIFKVNFSPGGLFAVYVPSLSGKQSGLQIGPLLSSGEQPPLACCHNFHCFKSALRLESPHTVSDKVISYGEKLQSFRPDGALPSVVKNSEPQSQNRGWKHRPVLLRGTHGLCTEHCASSLRCSRCGATALKQLERGGQGPSSLAMCPGGSHHL